MGCWPKLSLFRALKATHCHRVHLAMEQVGILDLANKTIESTIWWAISAHAVCTNVGGK